MDIFIFINVTHSISSLPSNCKEKSDIEINFFFESGEEGLKFGEILPRDLYTCKEILRYEITRHFFLKDLTQIKLIAAGLSGSKHYL